MEWLYSRRRGPEWKQGWTGQTIGSISLPPSPLLIIFAIVTLLLWLSQYTNYKAELHHSAVNFQFFIFLLPTFLILLLMASYAANWMPNLRFRQPPRRIDPVRSAEGSSQPWGIAVFVVLLLVLLSYQSSFHSKWFGPLRRSD
ncbi:uncharacterized protein LOC126681458 [Mercurialis annua]|uniref:uncharacterized protein LOC126681458 n=1 Tax=Mercurialis annua TaxID=3986 RepID=UPI00215E54F4|nr:uncharacterized protein LOC126681458 [Mercurialis annua]